MDNKKIAHHALNFIGGMPEVFEYHNDDKSKTIDIMTCVYDGNKDKAVVSTIGLNETNINKLTENNKNLRVELIMLALPEDDVFGEIISSAAFDIAESEECDIGMIIPETVENYISDAKASHIVLLNPAYWKNYEPFETDDTVITWLLVAPITDDEAIFIEKNGILKFTEKLQEKDVDLTDLWRESCV